MKSKHTHSSSLLEGAFAQALDEFETKGNRQWHSSPHSLVDISIIAFFSLILFARQA